MLRAQSNYGLIPGTNSKLKLRNARLILPTRINYQQVMATPPTVTLTNAHTITSPRQFPSTNIGATVRVTGSFFSYLQAGAPIPSGQSFPNNNFIQWTSVNYGSGGQLADGYKVSFMHYGSELEIQIKDSGQTFVVKIDDQYISLTPTTPTNTGNIFYFYIPFGSSKLRRIDFISSNAAFGGVWTGATDTVFPAPVRGSRCIVVGDSFTEGTGAPGGCSTNYVQSFADSMGWDDVWSSGVGGSGYSTATAGMFKYGDRLATDVFPFNPDVVIFTGGINSTGVAGADQTAALAAYQATQAALPNALVVAVDPFWRNCTSTMPASFLATRAGVKAAAAAAGIPFISITEMPFPLGYVPQVSTLFVAAAINATTIRPVDPMAPEGNFAFADGTRVHGKTVAGGSNIITLDGTLPVAQLIGATITEVGDCFWTGTGKVGTTTGYGNSDIFVSSDGTHPSQAGHTAMGQALAMALMQAMAPN